MKSINLLLMMAFLSCGIVSRAQIDTNAIFIFDHMSEVIGGMNSCRFQLVTSRDRAGIYESTVKEMMTYDVSIVGPDKMQVEAYGDRGRRGFWYDGVLLSYYSYDENNYSALPAPDSLLEMFNEINYRYDIDFPAADFFYPTFTTDILDNFSQVKLLGTSRIGDKDCYHILAKNDEMNVQFWLSKDAYTLPVKFNIVYADNLNRQYDATFGDWEINPIIPMQFFEFHPPASSKEIYFHPTRRSLSN